MDLKLSGTRGVLGRLRRDAKLDKTGLSLRLLCLGMLPVFSQGKMEFIPCSTACNSSLV